MALTEFIESNNKFIGSWERKVKKMFPDDYKKIISNIRGRTFKEKLYLYVYPETNEFCEKCGKQTNLFRFSQGFRKFCSPTCRGKAPILNHTPLKVQFRSLGDVDAIPSNDEIFLLLNEKNYLKNRLKKNFKQFYEYVETNFEGNSLVEKIFQYLNGYKGYCKHCGNETSFDTWIFQYKPFCSKLCANIENTNLTGGYPIDYFEKYPERKNDPGKLYVLRLYNDIENFIKVGMTKNTIDVRANDIVRKYYQYEILKVSSITLFEAACMEKKILNQFKKFSYRPINPISGKTECFLLDVKEEICQMI